MFIGHITVKSSPLYDKVSYVFIGHITVKLSPQDDEARHVFQVRNIEGRERNLENAHSGQLQTTEREKRGTRMMGWGQG